MTIKKLLRITLLICLICFVKGKEIDLRPKINKSASVSDIEKMKLVLSPNVSFTELLIVNNKTLVLDFGFIFEINNPLYIFGYNRILFLNTSLSRTNKKHIHANFIASYADYFEGKEFGFKVNAGFDFVRAKNFWGNIYGILGFEVNFKDTTFKTESILLFVSKGPADKKFDDIEDSTYKASLQSDDLVKYIQNKPKMILIGNTYLKLTKEFFDLRALTSIKYKDFNALKPAQVDIVGDFTFYFLPEVSINISIGYNFDLDNNSKSLFSTFSVAAAKQLVKSKIRNKRIIRFFNKIPMKYFNPENNTFVE